MRPGVLIVMIAMGLLTASAGVLYPVRSAVRGAREDVARLEQELGRERGLRAEAMRVRRELEQTQQSLSQRVLRLCPDTPEAQHEFEAGLLGAVESSGLSSVRMDRRRDLLDGDQTCLVIDLVVDGDAQALHRFLRVVEGLPWVTRVLSLSIDPGAAVRRITLQLALVLEPSP
jgi:hypothetical protein